MPKKTLVIGGGGIKGFMYLGALKFLFDDGTLDHIETFAGTSVGGIIASLLAIGYTPDELYYFSHGFDFEKLKNSENVDAFGLIMGNTLGLHNDERVEETYKKLIGKKTKPDITLKELYEWNGRKLIVTATCVNTQSCCYISHENYPDMTVYTAIRMTSCIPFLFSPVEYKGLMYVDGGCMDIYPIGIFSENLDDVIGICSTQSNSVDKPIAIDDLMSYVIAIMRCLSDTRKEISNFKRCTIEIKSKPIFLANFSLEEKDKMNMFASGYVQTGIQMGAKNHSGKIINEKVKIRKFKKTEEMHCKRNGKKLKKIKYKMKI